MAADLPALTKIYRLRAKIAAGDDLGKQRDFLTEQFTALDAGGTAEMLNVAGSSGSSGWQHRGATPEEKLKALYDAIVELDAEIAAETGGTVAPARVGALTPRFCYVPH